MFSYCDCLFLFLPPIHTPYLSGLHCLSVRFSVTLHRLVVFVLVSFCIKGEQRCPRFCLALESCLCLGLSMSSTRNFVMDTYDLRPDPCDNRLIRFSNCSEFIIDAMCLLYIDSWIDGSDDWLIDWSIIASTFVVNSTDTSFTYIFIYLSISVYIWTPHYYSFVHFCLVQLLSCVCHIMSIFMEELRDFVVILDCFGEAVFYTLMGW